MVQLSPSQGTFSILDINQARKHHAPTLQGVRHLFVQLPIECLLHLNRTELSADKAQNCLPLGEKYLTSCQAP
jgi:hypothetical protein